MGRRDAVLLLLLVVSQVLNKLAYSPKKDQPMKTRLAGRHLGLIIWKYRVSHGEAAPGLCRKRTIVKGSRFILITWGRPLM